MTTDRLGLLALLAVLVSTSGSSGCTTDAAGEGGPEGATAGTGGRAGAAAGAGAASAEGGSAADAAGAASASGGSSPTSEGGSSSAAEGGQTSASGGNGGSPSGGSSPSSGGSPSGGSPSGGSPSGGSPSGGSPSGGSPSGGSPSGGGSSGMPSTDCGVPCANPPVGSCDAPEVRITEIELGVRVSTNESETELRPLAIGAMPSGGSRLAFMSEDDAVHVAQLDCSDELVGSPFAIAAHDYQDIAADASGGVVLLTRDARGGGTLNCGNPGNLCDGGPNPPIPCHEMWMVRYDCAGNELWDAPLTTSSEALPPYSTGPTGETALMIWWYQHQGRLAFDGSNYAAYFGVAISISENGCINIHQGDRMVVVDPSGDVLEHPDDFGSWGVGCSHSWNTRIAWDEGQSRFVMVCATDNQGRVAQPDPYRTVYTPDDLGTLSVGGLVVASGAGYWVTASDLGTVHLLHFTDGLADQDLEVAQSDYSHLVEYGQDHMLLAWGSASGITARVLDRATGSPISQEFSIAVPDNIYQSFEPMADGSVAFAAEGTTPTSVRIARLMPCE